MNFILRRANAGDAPRIEDLYLEMVRTICQTEDVQGYDPGYLDKYFSDTEDWICAAESGGEIKGFLSIEVHREGEFVYLDDFSVTENARNCGIGTKLIQKAEEYAIEKDIGVIVLHVEKTNTSGRRFYLRFGYKEDEEQGSRIRMIKKLVN